MIYFLVVNYQSFALVSQLINRKAAEARSRWVIVNNDPPEKEALKNIETENIHLIEAGKNLGFGCACNLGLSWIYQQDCQALVWLINPDTIFDSPMIKEALTFIENYPEISILGTVIYSTDYEIWFGGGTFNSVQGKITSENLLSFNAKASYVTCDWVSGCSMMINLNHFSECPQFDPHYFLYYEDFDFCQRYQRQGHLVAVTNEISIVHQVSAVTNRNLKQKFYHSSYSYLLTLEKYTNQIVFSLRLTRLLTYALILLPIKPAIALGKITGAWHYFQKRLFGVTSCSH
ncbi:MAG: glycosyl transferase [Cyanobacteria bacterium SW_9_44_58]|nr:MAG: glycosyl transferase [Cyanobacteria bacterium SW_9_44_58]